MLDLEDGLRSVLATELDVLERILIEVTVDFLQLVDSIHDLFPIIVPGSELRDEHPRCRCAEALLLVVGCPCL